MNILKIKNTQGNWVDIPALKGDKGDKGDPGISPTIDSTLSQANQAADAKAVGDKIDEITLTIDETLTQSGQVADAKVTGDALNTKADQNGYYENLNVGVADQLASKNYIDDNEAYTFRPTGGGAKVGTREFDTIVGGSIVWNQLVDDTDSSVTVTSGHKYIAKISGSYSVVVSEGTAVAVTGGTDEVFDVTQMFGSTIADYIYSLEQATAGAGVAWFRKNFPNSYYDYNPGELMHVSGVSAHKTYDADENVIGNYPLDPSLTLKGIPKLVDGKLAYNGDVYKPDGTVERRYGIVDLGTLNWAYGTWGANTCFSLLSILSDMKSNGSGICAIYPKVSATVVYANVINKAICFNNQIIRIVDTAYSDAETFKTAMSGVYLVYELAEPTTETTQPYQSPQIIDPYGTEEYVTTSLIPVGHQTQYPEDLRAKIESLPWDFANLIAPVETTYIATRNYTSGSLFIIDNILYKAIANIANGGIITPNTNCTPTTLAEIIAAL